MFDIAVCDDEKKIAEIISSLVKKYLPECRVRTYDSGISLLSDIGNNKINYDILFLDINMQDLNGIETAVKLRENNSDTIIIFISAIKEYVFNAFDVNAFHYLLKPLDEEKLKSVLKRAESELRKKSINAKKRVLIKTRKRSIKLETAGILYFENEMRKIAAHTINDVIKFYGSMSDIEEQLGSDFFRCHRGYLVNMDFIEEYNSENIYLTNGEHIYMAKEKYSEFVKCYMRFLRNEGTLYV